MALSLVDEGPSLPDSRASALRDAISTTKGSAQALSLSFENLNAIQLPLPRSNATSPTWQYLSPPLSIANRLSPPPRQGTPDYFTLDQHQTGKRKRKRHHKPLIRSENSAMTELSLAHALMPSPASPEEKVHEPIEIRTLIDAVSAIHIQSTSVAAPQSQDQRASCGVGDSLESDLVATFEPPAPKESNPLGPSPALDALRHLNRVYTQPPTERIMRRFSRALTGTFSAAFDSKFADLRGKTVNGKAGFPALNNRQNQSSDYATRNRGGDLSAGGRSKPATITLRKASVAYPPLLSTLSSSISTSSEPSRSFDPPVNLLTPTTNLVAFTSKHMDNRPPSVSSSLSSLSFRQEGPSSPKSNESIKAYSWRDDLPMGRKMARSASLLLGAAPNRRRTVIADTALTKTQFFPCPGTLINPGSKTIAVPPVQTSVRTSVVRFVSHTSVHEIIWREDETSSSVSSSSATSPNKSETRASERRKEPQEIDHSHGLTPLEAEIQEEPSFRPPSDLNDQIPDFSTQRDGHEALFDWSWR